MHCNSEEVHNDQNGYEFHQLCHYCPVYYLLLWPSFIQQVQFLSVLKFLQLWDGYHRQQNVDRILFELHLYVAIHIHILWSSLFFPIACLVPVRSTLRFLSFIHLSYRFLALLRPSVKHQEGFYDQASSPSTVQSTHFVAARFGKRALSERLIALSYGGPQLLKESKTKRITAIISEATLALNEVIYHKSNQSSFSATAELLASQL